MEQQYAYEQSKRLVTFKSQLNLSSGSNSKMEQQHVYEQSKRVEISAKTQVWELNRSSGSGMSAK